MEGRIMRKVFFFAAVMCAALVSCNKSELNREIPDAPGMKTVTISGIVDDATKTSYADGTKFSWTAGDKISVYCSDSQFYTFTATETGASSEFVGSIPENVSLGAYAFFPAEEGHSYVSGSYKFSIPEYKDLTSHPSADMPMVGDKGEGDAYSFVHCSGAALMTVTDIPETYTSVEISIVNASLKISGLYSVYKSSGAWAYSAAGASNDSEKTFVRKVVVNDSKAQVYLPYAAGADLWAKSVVNVTGFNSSNESAVLIKDKQMKSLPEFARATVLPLTPLAVPPVNNLKNIDWSDGSLAQFDGGHRFLYWQATSDKNFIYINYKVNPEKIGPDKYIYIGLDYAVGGGEVGGGVTGDAWDVKALVYPFEQTAEGTTGFKDGEDSKSYIQYPIGTSTGVKINTTGHIEGTDGFVSVSIPRASIGSPVSGTNLSIQSAMDWYPSDTGVIVLE